MNASLRWGIIGPGAIAHSLTDDIALVPGNRITAVASRSQERSKAFAQKYDIPLVYDSYHQLAASPDVDIVYIATPHHLHAEHAILAMQQGKAVLCEKPMATSAIECKRMIDCAKANGVFLMEGMWMRFFPASRHVLQLLRDGAIGELRAINAVNSFRIGWNPSGRHLNADLAGGGLLDVGCYPLSYTLMCMGGEPESVAGYAHIGETGVDEQAMITMQFSHGRLATVACGVRTDMPGKAFLFGTEGMLEVPEFWQAKKVLLHTENQSKTYDFPYQGHGFQYEIAHVQECMQNGLLDSPIMPLHETTALIRLYDQLRGQWGLRYPFEIA